MLADFPIDDPIIAALLVLLHANPDDGDLAATLAMDAAQWSAVLTLATDEHVHPYLYWNLQRLDALSALPEALRRQLHAGYLGNAARNRALLHFVEQILTTFAARNLPVIVLKGTYLVDHVYPSPGARAVGDSDLLVPADRIAEAVAVLESLGYVGSEPFSPTFLTVRKHLGIYKRAGHPVELHYELMDPHEPIPVPVAEIWQRAVPATVAGCPVLVGLSRLRRITSPAYPSSCCIIVAPAPSSPATRLYPHVSIRVIVLTMLAKRCEVCSTRCFPCRPVSLCRHVPVPT